MAEGRARLWWYRFLFVVFAVVVFAIRLLPLDPGPGQWPGPDLLLLIALAWTIMRPALMPVWLVAIVFLAADFLLMRPPGLWSALAVLGCEFLRSRRPLLRNVPFLVEWVSVVGVVTAMFVLQVLVLSIFSVPQPAFGLTVMQLLLTGLAYPVVVVLAGRALGLSKAPGDRDALGARG